MATLLQYFTTIPIGGIAPVVALYAAGLLAFLRKDRQAILRRVFANGGVLFLYFSFSEVVSIYSGWDYSMEYGIILICLVLAIRMILLQIGFLQIVHCYITSATVCTLVIMLSGKKEIADYQVGQVNRFQAGSVAHPNLLGFTAASYLPIFIGVFLDSKVSWKRAFSLFLILCTMAVLFLAGSRGSLAAVILPALILLVRYSVFQPLIAKLRLSILSLLGSLLGAGFLTVFFAQKGRLSALAKFMITALSLDSKYRGVNSGFSGRTEIWLSFFHRMSGLQWIFGYGFRQAYIVDNGYITVLFDNGIFGVIVVTGSILKVLYWLWVWTGESESWGWWRYRVVMLTLILAYLFNCISARYLLSYGNQYSLLILFMILSSKRDLLGQDLSLINTPVRTLLKRKDSLVSMPRPERSF